MHVHAPLARKHGAAASRARAAARRVGAGTDDAGVTAAAVAVAKVGLALVTVDTCSDDPVFLLVPRPLTARARRVAATAKVVLAEAESRPAR